MKKWGFLWFILILFLTAGCSEKSVAVYSGFIEAENINISAQGAGIIEKVFVTEGEKVSMGAPLLSIDHTLLSLRKEEGKMRLASLKERIKGLEIQSETAGNHFERIKRLYDDGAVSQTQLDEAEVSFIGAESLLQGTLIDAERIKKEIAVLDQQITDCTITAPRKGRVSEVIYKEGEYVRTGAIVMSLIDLDQMDIRFYVPEKDLDFISPGDSVTVNPDSMPGKIYQGRITTIAEESEFTPKNVQTKDERVLLVYKVKAFVENNDGRLKSGMNGDVIIPLNREKHERDD